MMPRVSTNNATAITLPDDAPPGQRRTSHGAGHNGEKPDDVLDALPAFLK